MLLNGIRVIDLSQYIPGPYLSRMLADLGADVIKVEPPAGDPMRYFTSENNKEILPAYRYLNHGKKIIRLNLKSQQGILKFKELLVDADILIDGFRPEALARLGLAKEELKQINPKLIHCALTGFGQAGPYSQRAGHDLGYGAVAGLLSKHNTTQLPQITYPPLADHVGALQASNSILAALFSRTRTGKGAFIDASLYEPILSWNYLTQSKHISQVLGGDAAYYNVYQAADGKFVTLAALELKFWRNFCLAVTKLEWVDRHGDEFPQQKLQIEVSVLFQSQDQRYWNELLKDIDCCYEPIPDVEDVISHPQTQFRKTADHYPNIIDDQLLSSYKNLNEITNIDGLAWD